MRSSASASFHPEAQDELLESAQVYADEDPALGQAFRNAVRFAVDQILEGPTRWPTYLGMTRRYILRRFPYAIVYSVEEAGILVVAVAHQHRRPGYWARRIAPP